ncbi:dihydrouridine synthase (dus) protein [Besnoitia besnoiti]|uniref:Dihydrouridine synthase (Dus) protein n=1 Tax=Besnoitia besnoiti TaxID=94643 RepID=A0A2A9MDP1_BESBE|nr:dihydrouridine synthase (dus) protein [Besnoitia besnoiti]PFH36115.1 dihydrouridine synthase (dus) protein [Besnoitia besnoiti]
MLDTLQEPARRAGASPHPPGAEQVPDAEGEDTELQRGPAEGSKKRKVEELPESAGTSHKRGGGDPAPAGRREGGTEVTSLAGSCEAETKAAASSPRWAASLQTLSPQSVSHSPSLAETAFCASSPEGPAPATGALSPALSAAAATASGGSHSSRASAPASPAASAESVSSVASPAPTSSPRLGSSSSSSPASGAAALSAIGSLATASDEGALAATAADAAAPLKPRGCADRYRGKWILAPMVRIGILPFRLECLKYGADLVYTEETIDHKLVNSVRTFNEDFGTTEFVHKTEKTCVFATCLEERGKVVLQLGTSNAARALRAATAVSQDVAAVDVNMGCPKSFSIKGGMGAALLKTPLIATDILKTLRRNLDIPVTCKIRLLDTIQQTIDFARLCENCGIEAIALHAREVHERPSHRAHWDLFPVVRSSLSIPLIANGDFLASRDVSVFQDKVGADSLMFARGAMWDPSIFSWKNVPSGVHAGTSTDCTSLASAGASSGGTQTGESASPALSLLSSNSSRVNVMGSYTKRALVCGAPYQAIKFCLQSMAAQASCDRNVNLAITASKSNREICEALGISLFYDDLSSKLPAQANSLHYHKTRDLVEVASTETFDRPLAFSSFL